jgi:hypothetical protein
MKSQADLHFQICLILKSVFIPLFGYQSVENYTYDSVNLNCLIIVSQQEFYIYLYILSSSICDYRWGLDWWMDLLTTYTHESELPAIAVLLLMYTISETLQHMLGFSIL